MSLKSFDKFCESLILNEPKSRREILDERQKQLRSKIDMEALLMFVITVFINTVIMERVYKWCESFLAPMLMFMAIALIYWTLRNAVKGTLFGINGAMSAKFTAIYCMFMGVTMGVQGMFGLEDGEGLIIDGVLSESVIFLVCFTLIFACGVVTYVLAKKDERRAEKTEEGK